MLLLSQGCCFIQSLLFSYVLREDSEKFSRIYFDSLSAIQATWYSVRTLISQQHPSGRRDLSVYTPICPLFHPSGRCVIPSGRHTVQHHSSGQRAPSVRTLYCIEKFMFQHAPFGRFSSTSRRLSVLERFTDSFQIPRNGRSINHPDDVVSRLDVCLHKARIAVQIDCPDVSQLWSESWCIVYGNYRFNFNRPDVCLSWSRRTHIRYGNYVLKFSRPDAHSLWSGRAKPVMEITCSERASVRTIEPSRLDDVLIQERFIRGNFGKSCRTFVHPDGSLAYFAWRPFWPPCL